MIVDIPHRAAVGLGLRPCNGVVHGAGVGLHLLRQRQGVNDLRDVAGGGVVMVVLMFVLMLVSMGMVVVMVMMMVIVPVVMMMVMLMLVVVVIVLQFLLAVDSDPHMGARDTAGDPRRRLHMNAGQAQAVHGFEKALLVLQKLIQGGHEHVPRRPHVTLNVKCFHCNPSI